MGFDPTLCNQCKPSYAILGFGKLTTPENAQVRNPDLSQRENENGRLLPNKVPFLMFWGNERSKTSVRPKTAMESNNYLQTAKSSDERWLSLLVMEISKTDAGA